MSYRKEFECLKGKIKTAFACDYITRELNTDIIECGAKYQFQKAAKQNTKMLNALEEIKRISNISLNSDNLYLQQIASITNEVLNEF